MSADRILFQLRRFLLTFSALIFLGTLLELAVINHTEEPMQWTPFILCGVGILAILAAYLRPEQKSLMALRVCMSLVAAGSLVGIYEHVVNNLAFALEINPNLPIIQQITEALGGANPLMAPGVLAMAAILAIAATYRHPSFDTAAQSWFGRPQFEKKN